MDVHSPADVPAPAILNPPLLRTLVVCDIADSTALVEKLGDQQAAQLVRKHDRLARALLEQHRGREIDKTDGFLLLFERPIHAVAFALDYQRGLKHLSAAEGVVVRARVGIHIGDVVVWENSPQDVARGAKPIEIEGLAKPIVARLAQLAQPRQILLTGAAASIARRAHAELGDCATHVRWRALGRYLFKGLPEAVEVHEVGEEGVAAFRAPRGSRTAKRILPWWRRPAVLAAEAAMLAVAIAIPAWLSTRSEPALAFAARDWVVVGDLQNLTGNSSFDQSVETALRISLEQSRYVNVLPELKVQETLQRMERDPAKTVVDRGVGSEVAMRDGARALVLPTLAEINGKLRVTAEVIDPNSQATVYSVSAEGMGAGAVLPALDDVGQQLRKRLGEALASVSKASLPLERVATKNLDALRAYSLGEIQYDTGNMAEALLFYDQAVRLDPGFALARIARARTLVSMDRSHDAEEEIATAEQFRDRLSAKDALYLDAWQATFSSPRKALEKWKLLTSLYPDFFAAQGAYGFFAWQQANDYRSAVAATRASASEKNPHRAIGMHLLGVLYLGEDRYADALQAFAGAKALGMDVPGDYWAATLAAERRFGAVDTTFWNGRTPALENADVRTVAMYAALLVDRGRWEEALRTIHQLREKRGNTADSARVLAGIELALRAIAGRAFDGDSLLTDYIVSGKALVKDGVGADVAALQHELLAVAYLAARDGRPRIANDILASLTSEAADGSFPALAKMVSVVQAEVARANGHPKRAIDNLKPIIDGSEPFVAHLTLAEAYADAGDLSSALAETEWMSSHRGRAYAEYGAGQLLLAYRVAQSDLATLRSAELLLAKGEKAKAKAGLDRFTAIWSSSTLPRAVSSRVATLQAKLR